MNVYKAKTMNSLQIIKKIYLALAALVFPFAAFYVRQSGLLEDGNFAGYFLIAGFIFSIVYVALESQIFPVKMKDALKVIAIFLLDALGGGLISGFNIYYISFQLFSNFLLAFLLYCLYALYITVSGQKIFGEKVDNKGAAIAATSAVSLLLGSVLYILAGLTVKELDLESAQSTLSIVFIIFWAIGLLFHVFSSFENILKKLNKANQENSGPDPWGLLMIIVSIVLSMWFIAG
jgi:hypothetical protein